MSDAERQHSAAIKRNEDIGRRLGWISGSGWMAVRTPAGQKAFEEWRRIADQHGEVAASQWLRDQEKALDR